MNKFSEYLSKHLIKDKFVDIYINNKFKLSTYYSDSRLLVILERIILIDGQYEDLNKIDNYISFENDNFFIKNSILDKIKFIQLELLRKKCDNLSSYDDTYEQIWLNTDSSIMTIIKNNNLYDFRILNVLNGINCVILNSVEQDVIVNYVILNDLYLNYYNVICVEDLTH